MFLYVVCVYILYILYKIEYHLFLNFFNRIFIFNIYKKIEFLYFAHIYFFDKLLTCLSVFHHIAKLINNSIEMILTSIILKQMFL